MRPCVCACVSVCVCCDVGYRYRLIVLACIHEILQCYGLGYCILRTFG